VTRELEDTEDAENAERYERAADVTVVGQAQADVVGQDGDYVYEGHHTARVLDSVRRCVQSRMWAVESIVQSRMCSRSHCAVGSSSNL